MNIIYLACHSVLEADEVGLLTELGHYVFSPGSWVEEQNPGDESMRPKPPPPPQHLERYKADMELFHKCGLPGKDNKENLSVELLRRFDAVIVMHIPIWVKANWERFKQAGNIVILREIGQSWRGNEEELRTYRHQGMKIIRYSPREAKIPMNNGSDALIRFFKDPEEFSGWTGEKVEVVNCAQDLLKRAQPCNLKWLQEVSEPFPRSFYGPGSEGLPSGKGKVGFEELKKIMREGRVYLSGGTFPASYTLSAIEGMLTGIPLVCVGPALGHPFPWFGQDHPLYEMGDIIENGVNGWCSDDLAATKDFIAQLLQDHDLAKKVGEAGRKKAIELFGKPKIMGEWKRFLEKL